MNISHAHEAGDTPSKIPAPSGLELAHRVAQLVLDRKAENVVLIDVQGKASYTDFLVIASGTSDRHVRALAENVSQELKLEHHLLPYGQEGLREGQWALVDYGSVVLHVFHQFARELYDLEDLWKEAPQTQIATESMAFSGPQTSASTSSAIS